MNLDFYIDLGRLKIHSRGFWAGRGVVKEHVHDEKLEKELIGFFKREKSTSVVDFGCGMGLYVKAFKEHGFTAMGYDGNPDTPKLSKKHGQVLDLSKPFLLGSTFDWVISLEVGEHIPFEYQETFLDNIHRHTAKGIILSWATPGQKGLGHFNEQTNQYVKEIITAMGYTNDLEAESHFRQNTDLPWFKHTIMVFRKQAS